MHILFVHNWVLSKTLWCTVSSPTCLSSGQTFHPSKQQKTTWHYHTQCLLLSCCTCTLGCVCLYQQTRQVAFTSVYIQHTQNSTATDGSPRYRDCLLSRMELLVKYQRAPCNPTQGTKTVSHFQNYMGGYSGIPPRISSNLISFKYCTPDSLEECIVPYTFDSSPPPPTQKATLYIHVHVYVHIVYLPGFIKGFMLSTDWVQVHVCTCTCTCTM